MSDASEKYRKDRDHGSHHIHRLILDIAESGRAVSDAEIYRIREHVAAVGFEPGYGTKAGPRIAGLMWNGTLIQSKDLMNNGVVHYLRHVVARQEWSSGTTFDEYVSSLRAATMYPNGGVLLHLLHDVWHLTFVTQSNSTRVREGKPWIAVGYRIHYDYWLTGYQPAHGLAHFRIATEKGERWLRRPRNPDD